MLQKVDTELPSTHLKNNNETSAASECVSPDFYDPLSKKTIPIIDPNNLVGRNFLLTQEDGQVLRSRIVKSLNDYELIFKD